METDGPAVGGLSHDQLSLLSGQRWRRRLLPLHPGSAGAARSRRHAPPSNDRPLATAGRTRAASFLPAEAGALHALREAEGDPEQG